MNQIEVCAYHEAGHVIMRHYHGFPTPIFSVFEDGTGMTEGTGEMIEDVTIRLDITLGGAVAENIYLGRVEQPSDGDIIELIEQYEADGFDEEWFGDYEDAIETVKASFPEWTNAKVVAEYQASFARCAQILEERWHLVESLAAAAQRHPDRTLVWKDIVEVAGDFR